MNDITKLLDLDDDNIQILDIATEGDTKILTIERIPEEHYCPTCGFRMYSRGIKIRTVRHQILQDGYKMIIKLRQRRWRCSNPECCYDLSDNFAFVGKSKQTTNTTELLVLDALLNLDNTFSDVGRTHNMTATQVINIFEKHINMKRLSLTEAVCVDEVYLEMDVSCKYVLVLQDFRTGDAIDLVQSRRDHITEPYFLNIPFEERKGVKYLISDMYNPYIRFVDKYFPNAISVVDSFHVMQWIIRRIDNFLRGLLREFKKRDQEKAEQLAMERNLPEVHLKLSDEVYLLQNHKWVVLKNERNIDYSQPARFSSHFQCYMDSYRIEAKFLSLHPDLPRIRDLKEKYVSFNCRYAGHPIEAAAELDDLIELYSDSNIEIFRDFSNTLKNYRQEILNSFIIEERIINGEVKMSRLSNGPMESLNRKAKDLKRLSRGFTNFEHIRNRFLFSTRKSPELKN